MPGHRRAGRVVRARPAILPFLDPLVGVGAKDALVKVQTVRDARGATSVNAAELGGARARRPAPSGTEVAGPHAMGPDYACILVGTDFSELAEAAFATALGFLRPGATLHLVHVLGVPADAFSLPTAQIEVARERLLALAEKAALVAPTANVTTRITLGSPAPTLARLASELGVDVVVLGTHGRGMSERLCGSVAERVMRAASCPVLAVKPREVRSETMRAVAASRS
jgi:nucleotide-binding universal stress UspA family protein